jgi:hypothetical protein
MEFEYSTSGDPVAGVIGGSIGAVVGLIMIIALWRVFSKAGRPGWWAIIPFVNTFQLVKIGGYSGWLFLLFFIPFVNLIVYIVVALGVAKNFGKSGLFGFLGLVIFSVIGWLILGFGSAKYIGNDKVVTA